MRCTDVVKPPTKSLSSVNTRASEPSKRFYIGIENEVGLDLEGCHEQLPCDVIPPRVVLQFPAGSVGTLNVRMWCQTNKLSNTHTVLYLTSPEARRLVDECVRRRARVTDDVGRRVVDEVDLADRRGDDVAGVLRDVGDAVFERDPTVRWQKYVA